VFVATIIASGCGKGESRDVPQKGDLPKRGDAAAPRAEGPDAPALDPRAVASALTFDYPDECTPLPLPARSWEGRSGCSGETECQDQCAAGDGRACNDLGVVRMKKKPADRDGAYEVLRRACDMWIPRACSRASQLAPDEVQEAELTGKAIAAHERHCMEGDHGACVTAGFGLEYETDDMRRQLAVNQKGCELGAAASCADLGRMYADGVGTPVDVAQAITAWDHGCRGCYVAACVWLGDAMLAGEHIERNAARAGALYERGCRFGMGPPCRKMAEGYRDGSFGEPDPARAAIAYQRMCDDKIGLETTSGTWCHELAKLVEAGDGVPKDEAKAKALYRRACDQGFEPACEAGLRGAN
jgi:TPR repeat protein